MGANAHSTTTTITTTKTALNTLYTRSAVKINRQFTNGVGRNRDTESRDYWRQYKTAVLSSCGPTAGRDRWSTEPANKHDQLGFSTGGDPPQIPNKYLMSNHPATDRTDRQHVVNSATVHSSVVAAGGSRHTASRQHCTSNACHLFH